MKNKNQCKQNGEDEKHEDAEDKENEENYSHSLCILPDEDDRCPICLNHLVEQEVGFPENCSHVFCLTCILKWAETRASCPVDRKQFQAVYTLNALKDCIKVQIKQHVSRKDDLLCCSKGRYCPMDMKNHTRKQENVEKRPLSAVSCKGWNQKHNSLNEEEVKNSEKKNKPRRQTCLNRVIRGSFHDRFSSNYTFLGESPYYEHECVEINKIDTVIGHKRRELELSCSMLARLSRIPSLCCEAEMAACLLISTVVMGTGFSISTTPLENFGSSERGHVVTYVREGEEKKQTSGTAGTRGSRRKVSDTAPRRRSARNVKTETLNQSQSSPKSGNSGCEASGDGDSFVNASGEESEKLPPKRKAKRGAKQQEPFVKKKLRSSGRYGKTSSDAVEVDESDETKITLLLDKGSLPESKNSTSGFSQKSDVESQSANGLENSKDSVECKEEPQKDLGKGQDILDIIDTDSCAQEPPVLTLEEDVASCAQDPPLLTLEGDSEKCEAKDTLYKDTSFYKNSVDQIEQHLLSLSNEELCDETVTLTHQSKELYSPTDELPTNEVEPAAIAEKPLDSPGGELLEKSECVLVSPTKEISTDELEPVSVTEGPVNSPGGELLEKSGCELVPGDVLVAPGNDLVEEAEDVAVTDKSLSGTVNKFPEELGSIAEAAELMTGSRNELRETEPLAAEDTLEKPGSEIPERPLSAHSFNNKLSGGKEFEVIVEEPLDNSANELKKLPVSLEEEDAKSEEEAAVRTLDHKTPQGTDVLLNISSEDQLEISVEKISEESRPDALSNICTQEIKHFSEDNTEIVAMECDSFSSDQNDSQIDQPLMVESLKQETNSVIHDTEQSTSFSGLSDKKEETESNMEIKKDKKARVRRSRFHSPSTTWSPSKREGKRSQSPSPKREIVSESRMSRSPKRDTCKEGQQSLSQSPRKDPLIDEMRSLPDSPKKDISGGESPSTSPKRDLTEGRISPPSSPKRNSLRDERKTPPCSPQRDPRREGRRSWVQAKESSPRHKCRSQSRDRESDKDGLRRDHERERSRRRWSQSRSRSRSRSRTRSKGPSFPRNERDSYSPPRWKERWTNDNWRDPRGNDRYKRNEQEKHTESMKRERDNANRDADKQSSEQYRKDYPDWIMERINSVPETRNRDRETFKNQPWEENRHNNSGPPWNRNFGSGWNSNRGRGGRGRGGRGRGGYMYGEQAENRWQSRKPHSGNADNAGNESSRFTEHQPYKRKPEQDFSFDTPADRSGWTSASSWAVRKTLPADVQNYYSKRGRNSSSPQSAWTKEEVTSEQDPNFKDQASQQNENSQLPINVLQPQMNVMTPVNTQHQPMNIFPYPMSVPTPIMNIQHNPFNLPPPVPMHLHTGVPLVQVAASANVSQGPPPPPPPPPPSQQINYATSQPDGKQLQAIPSTSHVANNMSATLLPAPAAALGSVETVQGPGSGNATSSSNIKTSNAAVKLAESKVSVTVEASADSSKKDQKLLIQEKAAQEVKLAIKPFYQNKDITKEEYKEIVRKAVDKVCHSKSGEVNSAKVANLVKAYVDKYKHSRKKNPEEAVSVEKK